MNANTQESLLHLQYYCYWENILSYAIIRGNLNYCVSLGMPLLTANITECGN
jgi:hypothetical protein